MTHFEARGKRVEDANRPSCANRAASSAKPLVAIGTAAARSARSSASALERLDAASRAAAVTALQGTVGNASVQRVAAIAREADAPGAAAAEEFRLGTISVVRDPILEALRTGRGGDFLSRLRALAPEDRLSLEADAAFVGELRARMRGRTLWIALLTLRFGEVRDQPSYTRDLLRAVVARDARLIKDLLRGYEELADETVVPGVRELLDHEFRGTPDHDELVRLAGEHELAEAHRRESYTEAHYERAAGGGYEMRSFTGLTAYEVSRTAGELRVVVRIRFRDTSGASYHLPDAKAGEWRGGIEASWNGRFAASNGATRLTIVFVPLFVTELGHHDVTVHTGGGRADEHNWYLEDDASTAAHEFGHMVGNPDEYRLPGGIAEIPASMGLTPAEEMRSSVEGIRAMERPRREGGYTLPGIMGAGAGAAERRHAWPVLDWYNRTMRPADEAPFRLE